MKRSVLETLVGATVILVTVLFASFAYKTAGMKSHGSTYKVIAKFSRIDGISSGSEVRIGGIKIGEVAELKLDKKTYLALLEMNINQDVKLPVDSSIQVLSDGLLGGKFVNIEPGADNEQLNNGGEIKFTQPSVSIENLIGKYIFGGGNKG